jgi:hypothetical protein
MIAAADAEGLKGVIRNRARLVLFFEESTVKIVVFPELE